MLSVCFIFSSFSFAPNYPRHSAARRTPKYVVSQPSVRYNKRNYFISFGECPYATTLSIQFSANNGICLGPCYQMNERAMNVDDKRTTTY